MAMIERFWPDSGIHDQPFLRNRNIIDQSGHQSALQIDGFSKFTL
jgi:hypothetical protein